MEADTGRAGQRPESTGCALGISAGLSLLVLAVLGVVFLGRATQAPADPLAVAAEVFLEGRAPFGLEPADATAYRGQAGALVARYARPSGAEPTQGPDDAAEGEGTATRDPVEIVLVRYGSAEPLRDLFRSSDGGRRRRGDPQNVADAEASRKLQRWEEERDFDWHTTVLRDQLRWDGWETDLQVDRVFTDQGTWSDTARINLGLGERYLALFARWPDGFNVEREDARRVARTVRMDG